MRKGRNVLGGAERGRCLGLHVTAGEMSVRGDVRQGKCLFPAENTELWSRLPHPNPIFSLCFTITASIKESQLATVLD